MEWLEEPVRFGVGSLGKSDGRRTIERHWGQRDEVHVSHR